MFKIFKNINKKIDHFNNTLNIKFNSSINNKDYREHEGANINVNTNILKEKEVFTLQKKMLIENKISQEIKPCLF